MAKSVADQIEAIIHRLIQDGVKEDPILRTLELTASHPDAVREFAMSVMQRYPQGGTFLDGALSFMPEQHWTELVGLAIDNVENQGRNAEAAESIIAHASLQSVPVLHPHLDRIFRNRPNAGAYYERNPWRSSQDKHFSYLRKLIEKPSTTQEDRRRAWDNLLATRHIPSIEFAMSCADRTMPSGWSIESWKRANLHLIGFSWQGYKLRRIDCDTTYHIQFDEEFFSDQATPPWLARVHPTWHLPTTSTGHYFGGTSSGGCSLCEQPLHRLLKLTPVPSGVGVTQIKSLEIATCLSCLGWEEQPLFYLHDESGVPVNVGYKGSRLSPQFVVGPLLETTVTLAETPERWKYQDWGLSNSRENLNRVGGHPSWVQDAEYPDCPTCNQLMNFLFQLDSNLATADGDEWLWGSGGIVYGFWCDNCKISALLWQCT